MENVDKDWIKRQFAKAISVEQSVIRAEKDHRDELKKESMAAIYDRIIDDDERRLDDYKQIAEKYGHKEGDTMESAGGLLGSIKSMVENVVTSDPFQSIGDDLMMKSNVLNYNKAWSKIFQDIGDDESAQALEIAAQEDEEHQKLMREMLIDVGRAEAMGERMSE